MKYILAVLAILFLALQYQLWFGKGGVVALVSIKHKISAQKQINQKLDDRNKVLIADIKDLRNGNQAIEERARNDLGMIKRNETFFRIVNDQPDPVST